MLQTKNSKGGGKTPGHGIAATATPSLGPWKLQHQTTGRRELKCPREIQAFRPRPPNAGSGLHVLNSAGLGHANALAHPLSPAIGRLGAAGDQPRLGMRRNNRQLSKFEEGEKLAKGTGRTLLPLPSDRLKSPWD